MKKIRCSLNLSKAIKDAKDLAATDGAEVVTAEYLFKALFTQDEFIELFSKADDLEGSLCAIDASLTMIKRARERGKEPSFSDEFREAMDAASSAVEQSGAEEMDVPHVLFGILRQENSFAREWLMLTTKLSEPEILSEAFRAYGQKPKLKKNPQHKETYWKQFCSDVPICDDVIGREAEVDRALTALCCSNSNNVVLVGEPGVGKSAIVAAVAAKIAGGDVPDRLKGRKVVSLDFGSILYGAQSRADVENRLNRTLTGLLDSGPHLVVIEDIHEAIGVGRTGGEIVPDFSRALLPFLGDERLPFIGTTTFDDYKRSIGRTRSLEHMFRRIDVEEPSEEDSVAILNLQRPIFEARHKVEYAERAVQYAVKASASYTADRALPTKALDLLDEAGAYREIHPKGKRKQTVDCALIDEVVSKAHGINLSGQTESSLKHLRDMLRNKIFGQDKAIDAVCEAVYSSMAGLSDPKKPKASFLFVGPTGVGKTQLANELGSALGMPVQRFDMSEYSEKHTVSKLIGAPAGYVGYEEGGILSDAVRKTPSCIVLLDEIEKAHPDIYNLLLQVMDYGIITDAKGQKADFRNTIIIMTSNAGAKSASQAPVGFGSKADPKSAMGKEVKNIFAPEFLNRLSATVVFNEMTLSMALEIVKAKVSDLTARLKDRGVELTVSYAAIKRLLVLGHSKEYGAREIERTISNTLRPLLVKELLFGSLKKGGRAEVDVEEGQFILKGHRI